MHSFIENIIKNRRIILWGTGNTGKIFWEKFHDKFPIFACTSNEKDITPIKQLNTIKWKEINPDKDFIIICSIYYEERRYQLMCIDGFEPNINFIKYSIFEEIYEAGEKKKRIIVAVGQCEIAEMCRALNMLSCFKRRYAVLYFDEQRVCRHGNKYNLEETKECMRLIKYADYFIKPSALTPKIMENFLFLQKNLGGQCQLITVSLFNMDSYWAQDIAKDRSTNKYYVAKDGRKLGAYIERDQVIEEFIDKDYSVNKIMDLICREDFFDYHTVINNHKNCIKRAQIADRVADIKMFDFIAQNFNRIKLYCDRGHFNENLLREYVKRILLFLGERESEKELSEKDISGITQHVNELPIYPSTAKILGLEWVNKSTLYRQCRYDGIKLVTFTEYMESFIQYCQSAKEVLKYSFWS